MKDIATNISLCESGVRARGAGGGGWLHFYPGQIALQKVHFRAMRTDVARGQRSTLQGCSPHHS